MNAHSKNPNKTTNTIAPKLPKAYKDGYWDFYGRKFVVSPDVLIPRPETEQIIDSILSLAGKPFLPGVKPNPRMLPEHPVILDVGTGSGCIAITVKKELPESIVIATDISEKALNITRKNADLHGVSIQYIISHLNEKVNVVPDVTIANLPYVDPEWSWLDKNALSHEPSIALYAGDHGLALIKELIDNTTSEFLILEADPVEHSAIISYADNYELLSKQGFILTLKRR